MTLATIFYASSERYEQYNARQNQQEHALGSTTRNAPQ